MRTKNRVSQRRRCPLPPFCLLALALLLSLAGSALAQEISRSNGSLWTIHYKAGTEPSWDGLKLELTMTEQFILGKSPRGELRIPAARVTALIPHWSPHAAYRENYTGTSAQEEIKFAAEVLVWPIFTVGSFFSSKSMCFTIRWTEGNSKKEAVLVVAAKDAPAIQAALERSTGGKVQDLVLQRTKSKDELKVTLKKLTRRFTFS